MNLDTPLTPWIYAGVDWQLSETLRRLLFMPLVEIIKKSTAYPVQIRNTAGEDALKKALRSGRVQYVGGAFTGQFSAAISGALRAMGARMDKRRRVYVLDKALVPGWAIAEAAGYQVGARETNDALRRQIDAMHQDLDAALDAVPLQEAADGTLKAVDGAFRHVAQHLELPPSMSPGTREKLLAGYTDNVKLSVRGFSEEMIESLRAVVEQNASEGYRADRLVAALQARYDITKNRARFIAREETRLFMSTYRASRFQDVGITAYVWSTSNDARVREDHRRLNRTSQIYASPPIVNTSTGKRGNPGGDYGCRCVDKPKLSSIARYA